MNLKQRDSMCAALYQCVQRGDGSLRNAPGLLLQIIREDAWRERLVEPTGEIVKFDSFDEFITTTPPDGLGATVEQIERLVRDDEDATTELRDVLKSPGRLRNNVTGVLVTGNALPYTLDRLKHQRPDLYERVKAKQLSANAAAIEAGFRKRTASIPVDTPEAAVQALLRRFTRSQLVEALGAA